MARAQCEEEAGSPNHEFGAMHKACMQKYAAGCVKPYARPDVHYREDRAGRDVQDCLDILQHLPGGGGCQRQQGDVWEFGGLRQNMPAEDRVLVHAYCTDNVTMTKSMLLR